MGRKRDPRREAWADQLRAAMREAGDTPLSTDQLAATVTIPWTARYATAPTRHLASHEAYPLLRSLETEGVAERIRLPGDRRVFWHWRGDPVQVAQEHDVDLEALWALS